MGRKSPLVMSRISGKIGNEIKDFKIAQLQYYNILYEELEKANSKNYSIFLNLNSSTKFSYPTKLIPSHPKFFAALT